MGSERNATWLRWLVTGVFAATTVACAFDGVRPDDVDDPDEPDDPVPVERLVTFDLDLGYTGIVDTMIDEQEPAESGDEDGEIRFDTLAGSGELMGLIRFDNLFGPGDDQIPVDATILSATLTVEITNGSDMPGALCDVVRPWPGDVAWEDFSQGDGPSAVTDFDPNPVTQVPVEVGLHMLDVTSSVANWHSGARDNDGWILVATSEDGARMASSETNNDQHPVLEVLIEVDP